MHIAAIEREGDAGVAVNAAAAFYEAIGFSVHLVFFIRIAK